MISKDIFSQLVSPVCWYVRFVHRSLILTEDEAASHETPGCKFSITPFIALASFTGCLSARIKKRSTKRMLMSKRTRE